MYIKGVAELKEKRVKRKCLQNHLPAILTVKLSKLQRMYIFKSNSNKKKLWSAIRDFFKISTRYFFSYLSQTPCIGGFLCNYVVYCS